MTYRDLCARFARAGIDDPQWDARLLLCHFLGDRAADCFLNPTHEIPTSDALLEAIDRRADRYPLQYLLGSWDFYRQTYEVSPDCLIPRSDTEILVEAAIKRLPAGALFADLCTGSGCIAVSTLAERPDTRALAVDKFENTLAIATRNAARNEVSDRFTPILADVLAPDLLASYQGRLDAILCNPPYIRTEVLTTLEPELDSEPIAALDGGSDGLLFYDTLLKNASVLLRPDGFILFEIGFDQADDLRRLAAQYGYPSVEILRDYGGNDRVVCIK